jgi:Undecaprenyl-phosphate galactose phosphotransferase WbaP
MPGALLLKRAIDVVAILAVAPLIVPRVALLAILVKLSSPGPIFYGHTRIGRNGRSIKVWKLRSMVPNADVLLKQYLSDNPHLKSDWERLHKLPNDPRVTSIGKIIRKTSLDEIPQLWNVFRGDMSLVGPRPIVDAEINKYQEAYPLYLRVTPGITGLWQVNGRNSTTYEERIMYDIEYVRNWSVSLDMYILARTIYTVVSCDGAC